MRWGDEHFVKLYTRDTPTWKAVCWQARALLPLWVVTGKSMHTALDGGPA